MIIKKLKIKPYCTYEELKDYIEYQLEYLQLLDDELNISFSKRTMQRDLREIRNLFGVDIAYSHYEKGYFITMDEAENLNFQRMMEAFELFSSLNMAQNLQKSIHLEKRRPQGVENMHGLLHAIKNCLQVRFLYQKFWEDETTERHVCPLALKEYRNRWYVLAFEVGSDTVKTFGLDRLKKLEITSERFTYPTNYSVDAHFRHCFGIISPNDEKPHEVVLLFNKVQGKYIKSLPLHHSQRILEENESQVKISLNLFITFDLVMELLSYGNSMQVLHPQSLIKQIKEAHHSAYEQYTEG